MAIDRDEIYNRFISAIELAVGSSLGEVTDELDNNVAAIYRDIDPYPTKVYPFVAINVGNREKQQTWAVNKVYDSTQDATRIDTPYNYYVTINVHSGVDANKAHEIADNIESSFARPDVNDVFRNDGFGEVSVVGDVTSNTYKSKNQVKGFANLVCKFTIVNHEYYNEDAILNVDAGLHLRHKDSDTDIVSTTISTDN